MKYTLQEGVKKAYSRWLISVPVSLLVLSIAAVDQQLQAGNALAWAGVRKKPVVVNTPSTVVAKRQSVSSQVPPAGSSAVKVQSTILAADTMLPSPSANVRVAGCRGGNGMHLGLQSAESSTLRKLAEYESACQSAVAVGSSFFVPTPRTNDEAIDYARDVSSQLHEYARYGVQPMVFMEPTHADGVIDLDQYKSGVYDGALAAYFAAIKNNGIHDAEMGVWVLFPEGNIPVWNNVDPLTYATNVTRTAQALKAQFPSARTSLLLDSQTYPLGTSWSGGRYASLTAYVSHIPKGLIDSFGLQGFPWAAPANEPYGSLYEPRTYLAVQLASEAARTLGTSDVWVNTGTFSVAYAGSQLRRVDMDAVKRQAMLDGIVSQVQTLKNQGFRVSVHLFAEDKSSTSEGINWSYWPKGGVGQGPAADVFRAFVHDMQVTDTPLWIFDS